MTMLEAAPLDRLSRGVTTAVAVLLLVLGAVMAAFVPDGVGWLVALSFAVILGVSWAMAPKGYAVENGDLLVVRNAWRPFRSAVHELTDLDRPGHLGLRVGGSGGAFGYWGRFRRKDTGVYRAYLTTRDAAHIVAVRTDAGLVTVSPADPDGLAALLEPRTP